MNDWLIRTSKNKILGPFPVEKVRQFILNGNLDQDDEVCQANQYWFALHETAEVRKFLNIDVSRKRETQGEITDEITEPILHNDGPTQSLVRPDLSSEAKLSKSEADFFARNRIVIFLVLGVLFIVAGWVLFR